MNDSDRKLVRDLFDRMAAMGPVERDSDADAEIGAGFARSPDAAYKLVQSVLVQEHALRKADARIKELEARFAEGEAGHNQPDRSLGMSGAVPAAGIGRAGPDRNSGQPPRSDGPQFGGFMSQAMSTAAGVAGGMLLASGISSLFSSDASASTSESSAQAAEQPTAEQTADAGQQADATEMQQAIGADTAGTEPQEADFEDDGWGDWGDFGDIDV